MALLKSKPKPVLKRTAQPAAATRQVKITVDDEHIMFRYSNGHIDCNGIQFLSREISEELDEYEYVPEEKRLEYVNRTYFYQEIMGEDPTAPLAELFDRVLDALSEGKLLHPEIEWCGTHYRINGRDYGVPIAGQDCSPETFDEVYSHIYKEQV